MDKQILVGFAIFLILLAPLASSESDEEFAVDYSKPEMTTGDYFLYELDMTGLVNTMEIEEIEEVRENSNSGMRLEYGGDSCLQTNWSDCRIGLMNWDLNLTMVFSNGSGIDNDQIIMLRNTESTNVFSEMKSEDTTVLTIDMWYTIDGEAYHEEMMMTEVSITTKAEKSTREFVIAGDTWTTGKSVETITNEKWRMNGEPWEYEDEIIENESITTNYNAENISNVYIKNTSYQTLKIKSQELGSDEMKYDYLTDSGMSVKRESYKNGSLQMIATLADYSWTNEPTKTSDNIANLDDEMPGFTLVSALLASMSAIFFVSRNE